MIRRTLALMITGIFVLGGLAAGAADDPPEKDEPPLRLKKKKRDQPDGKEVDPGKEIPDKPDPKKKEPPKGKAEEGLDAEDPADPWPEDDDTELLERIARNMRLAEEKLGNEEVGDPLRQTQDDVLKDIDALIRKKDPSGGDSSKGGGSDDQPPPSGGGSDTGSRADKGGRQSKGGMPREMRSSMVKGPRPGEREGEGRQGRDKGRMARRPGGGRPGTEPLTEPPRGGTDEPVAAMPKRPTNDTKDIWGHLPESLRAEMDAYSKPQPFLPRYDDLIKKYYRTIAEQGSRKGD